MKLINREPNLSIVLPGPCNCNCEFCFWNKNEHNKATAGYIGRLKAILNSLPEEFYQISITGGEPTLSPVFDDVLNLINEDRFKKIVLTTNANHISSKMNPNYDNYSIESVNHVNISRHHFDDSANKEIFGIHPLSPHVPNKDILKKINNEFNQIGIDVTLNCVYSYVLKHINKGKNYTEEQAHCFVLKYIDFAKSVGANYVCFRKEHSNLEETEAEKLFKNMTKVISEGHCPVCRSHVQFINGMQVTWKASVSEPSIDSKGVYELIVHPNGKAYIDWAGNHPISNSDIIKLGTTYDKQNNIVDLGNLVKGRGRPRGTGGFTDILS